MDKYMNQMPFPVIETSGLILRRMRIDDIDQVYKMRRDSESLRYVDRAPAETLKDAEDYIKLIDDGVSNNKWIFWAVTRRTEDIFIGSVCLWDFSERRNVAELSFELISEVQHMGIMDEAVSAVLAYGFNALMLDMVKAHTSYDNTQSINMLIRNGFEYGIEQEGTGTDLYILRRKLDGQGDR